MINAEAVKRNYAHLTLIRTFYFLHVGFKSLTLKSVWTWLIKNKKTVPF